MTLRCKTIEYAYVINNASLATATRLNFSAITLTIPEQTSLTFLSCEVDVTCEGGQTGGTATTARLIGISVNGVSFDDQTLTYTVSNSSNTQLSYHFSRDVTAHFNTNWPAATTTATCQVGLQFTGPTTINHCVKILLTYQFDDHGQTTRVKTVRIPLDAKNGGLTTSLANIGTNQIPNLSTFCPENSPTFLNMWVQFEGNNGALAGTNSTITFGLDLVSSITTQTSIHTQANNYWVRYLFDVSSMSTTASHNVSLQTSSANYAFPSASLVLYVTYTYNHSATTTVLNSLVMAISDGRQRPGIDSTNYTRYATSFSIPESTPTLVQSGILMYGGDITMTAWNMRAGAQTFTTYTFTSGQIGDVAETCVSFRVDSGGAGGTGITIASGACTVTVDTYSASPTDDDSVGSLVSPVLYLNPARCGRRRRAQPHDDVDEPRCTNPRLQRRRQPVDAEQAVRRSRDDLLRLELDVPSVLHDRLHEPRRHVAHLRADLLYRADPWWAARHHRSWVGPDPDGDAGLHLLRHGRDRVPDERERVLPADAGRHDEARPNQGEPALAQQPDQQHRDLARRAHARDLPRAHHGARRHPRRVRRRRLRCHRQGIQRHDELVRWLRCHDDGRRVLDHRP